MKKGLLLFLSILMILATLVPLPVLAATPTGLLWDGKPATLTEISKNCGYIDFYGEDFVATGESYRPLWYSCAKELWNDGLFLGSNGSFDLDRPLTRAEGVVTTIRLLGKEAEAKATTTGVTFTDVPDWAKPYVAYAVKSGIANGYSASKFGSSDPMTAPQFITLVLRALGYQDGVDFTWNKSYDKAFALKLFGKCEYALYSRSNLFMRDDAVGIAYNAVYFVPMKSGALLKDTITKPGKPSGSVPTATRPVSVPAPTIDKRTELFLTRVDNVMWLSDQVRNKGNRPTGSTYLLVNYNSNGTLSSYLTLSSQTLFTFSQPRIGSEWELTESAPSYEALWDCRDALSAGTYDFAKDPASLGLCFLDNGDAIWGSLAAFQAATNNKAVTQAIFDTIKKNLITASGTNAAILYRKNADGQTYGYAIVLNLATSQSDSSLGCPYFNLNPDDKAFGHQTTVFN